MTCKECLDRLDALADDELVVAERATVVQHLEQCTACQGEWQRTTRLLHLASELTDEIEPVRELWPGIAERLAPQTARVVELPRRNRLYPVLAAAAVALLSLASVLFVHHSLRPAEVAESSLSNEGQAAAVQAAYLGIDRDLAAARENLRQALDARREHIQPATMAVVAENLAIIEDSIVRIAQALEEEPGNPELNRMLLAACRSELRLLQQVTDFR